MRAPQRRALLTATADAIRDEIDDIESEFQTEELPEGRMVELTEELNVLVSGIGRVVRTLIESEEGQGAEVLLAPALERSLREDVQPTIEETLSAIERAEQREFNLVLARWLSHRPTDALARFGSKLNPAALQRGENAEIEEILARLWNEALTERGEEAKGALSILAGLRHEGANLSSRRLIEEAGLTLENPPETEEEVGTREAALQVLRFLAQEGLLAPLQTSRLQLALVRSLLSQAPNVGIEDTVIHLLLEALYDGRRDASDEELEEVREGLANSPWAVGRSPLAETVELLAVGALAQKEKRRSPFESKKMTELATEYQDQFERGAAAWLVDFRPKAVTAARVLAPFLNRELPARLSAASTPHRWTALKSP